MSPGVFVFLFYSLLHLCVKSLSIPFQVLSVRWLLSIISSSCENPFSGSVDPISPAKDWLSLKSSSFKHMAALLVSETKDPMHQPSNNARATLLGNAVTSRRTEHYVNKSISQQFTIWAWEIPKVAEAQTLWTDCVTSIMASLFMAYIWLTAYRWL